MRADAATTFSGFWTSAGIVAGSGLLAICLLAPALVLGLIDPIVFVALPAAIFGGFLLLKYPYLGVLGLIVFAHLDGISARMSKFLPLSFYELLAVGTIGAILLTKRFEPKAPDHALSLRAGNLGVLFMLAAIISGLMSADRGASFDRIQDFLIVFVIFLLVLTSAVTVERVKAAAWVLIGTGGVSALVVIADTILGTTLISTSEAATTAQWEGNARSSGASNMNPTTAAHMQLATTFIAAVFFVHEPRWRWLSGLALALGAIALLFTFARSALIAGVIAGAVLALSLRRARLFALAAFGGVGLVVLALPFVPEAYYDRIATLGNFSLDRTLLRRVSYILIGFDLWTQNPLLGIGPGNYPAQYAGFEYRFMPGREPVPRQLHNSYVEVLVENGIIGFSLFLAFILTAFTAAFAAGRAVVGDASLLAKAFAYGFLAFLIGSIFMPNEDTKFMWILPALCLAAVRLMPKGSAAR